MPLWFFHLNYNMVIIGRYSNRQDAQLNADRIASRGIEVKIFQSEMLGPIGGNQPGFELQIFEEDLEQLEQIREGLLEEMYAVIFSK